MKLFSREDSIRLTLETNDTVSHALVTDNQVAVYQILDAAAAQIHALLTRLCDEKIEETLRRVGR